MIGAEGLHPVIKPARFQSFRNFVPKLAFNPILLVKHGILCEMRPWSAGGELSHDALEELVSCPRNSVHSHPVCILLVFGERLGS